MCYNKKQHAKAQLKDVCSKLHCQGSIKNNLTKFLTLSKRFANFSFTIVKGTSTDFLKRLFEKCWTCDKAYQFLAL